MSTLPSVLGVFVRFWATTIVLTQTLLLSKCWIQYICTSFFPECFRFCCLMAGAIYWADFPLLWLSRFCSVSEPFEVNSNILHGSCSVKPHLFDKRYCTKWNGKLGRWSVMICFLLEFKRQWENSHALPSETAGSEGRYSSEFKLWWTMFLPFSLQDTR